MALSCLFSCFPVQSADWRHLVRLRRPPGHGPRDIHDLWLRPECLSLLCDSCFSHIFRSQQWQCAWVCVCVFLGAIMLHSKITIISVSFAQCFNYFFLNHSGSRHHRYETTPQVRTQYQPAGSTQGRPLSHTIDKTSCVTGWIQQ